MDILNQKYNDPAAIGTKFLILTPWGYYWQKGWLGNVIWTTTMSWLQFTANDHFYVANVFHINCPVLETHQDAFNSITAVSVVLKYQ